MLQSDDIAKYLDFLNTTQVKVRIIEGEWWYKPYPFPEEKTDVQA